MPCPNCSCTLQLCGTNDQSPGDQVRIRHCGRCGTMVHEYVKAGEGTARPEVYRTDVYTPALVERCRTFEAEELERYRGSVPAIAAARDRWRVLGIQEAINPPEGRPRG